MSAKQLSESAPAPARRTWFEPWSCQSPDCTEATGPRPWYRRAYTVELQGGRCCSPQCLERAVARLASDLAPIYDPPQPRPHRIPLGLLLLSRNVIQGEQLRHALESQHAHGRGRLGEWLRLTQGVSEDQITAGVALQWARPLFPLTDSHSWRQCRGWLPLTLMDRFGMAPLHFAADQHCLYVGFTTAVAFHALSAVQAIYGCRTEACIIGDSALDRVLAEFRQRPVHSSAVDLTFDNVAADEVGGIVRQYAQRLVSRQVRIAAVAPFVWARLQGEHASHLLFRVAASSAAGVKAPAQALSA